MFASSSKRARSSTIDRDVLAGLRGGDQRVDDRRFVAGAVQRLLDREHARDRRAPPQEVEHRAETVERVVQQDVLLPDAPPAGRWSRRRVAAGPA